MPNAQRATSVHDLGRGSGLAAFVSCWIKGVAIRLYWNYVEVKTPSPPKVLGKKRLENVAS